MTQSFSLRGSTTFDRLRAKQMCSKSNSSQVAVGFSAAEMDVDQLLLLSVEDGHVILLDVVILETRSRTVWYWSFEELRV